MNIKIYKWNYCVDAMHNFYFPMKEDEYANYDNNIFVDYKYNPITGIAESITKGAYILYINGIYMKESNNSLNEAKIEFGKYIKQKVFE